MRRSISSRSTCSVDPVLSSRRKASRIPEPASVCSRRNSGKPITTTPLSVVAIRKSRISFSASKRGRRRTKTSRSLRAAWRGSTSSSARAVGSIPRPLSAGIRSGSSNACRSRLSWADSAGWLKLSRAAACVTFRSFSNTSSDTRRLRSIPLISIIFICLDAINQFRICHSVLNSQVCAMDSASRAETTSG